MEVGDLVMVLPRDPDKEYKIPYLDPMMNYAGQTYRIKAVEGNGCYYLDNGFYWSEDMLYLMENFDPTVIL